MNLKGRIAIERLMVNHTLAVGNLMGTRGVAGVATLFTP